MLSLKKVYRDELLQLALILSLLRVHPESYFENDLYNSVNNLDLDNGTSWRSFSRNSLRSYFVHPKSLDSVLLNYEREVFADLNSLGRYNRDNILNNNVTAYLLNIERTTAPLAAQEGHLDLVAAPQNQQDDAAIANANEASTDRTETDLQLTQEVSHFYLTIFNL